jgi:hypothetical protein
VGLVLGSQKLDESCSAVHDLEGRVPGVCDSVDGARAFANLNGLVHDSRDTNDGLQAVPGMVYAAAGALGGGVAVPELEVLVLGGCDSVDGARAVPNLNELVHGGRDYRAFLALLMAPLGFWEVVWPFLTLRALYTATETLRIIPDCSWRCT